MNTTPPSTTNVLQLPQVQAAQSLAGTVHLSLDPVSATALYAAVEIRCLQLAKECGHVQHAAGYIMLELVRSKLHEVLANRIINPNGGDAS